MTALRLKHMRKLLAVSVLLASFILPAAQAADDSANAQGKEKTHSGGFLDAIEANVDYPMVMGTIAQNYSSSLGGDATIYFPRFLDPDVPNYISVGYHSFGILADGRSTFRLIPVMVGIDFVGKVFKDFNSVFGLAMGGAFGYMSLTNSTVFNMSGYFAAGVKTGFEWWISDSLAITGHAPITFVIGKKLLTYAPFNMGIKFRF